MMQWRPRKTAFLQKKQLSRIVDYYCQPKHEKLDSFAELQLKHKELRLVKIG